MKAFMAQPFQNIKNGKENTNSQNIKLKRMGQTQETFIQQAFTDVTDMYEIKERGTRQTILEWNAHETS